MPTLTVHSLTADWLTYSLTRWCGGWGGGSPQPPYPLHRLHEDTCHVTHNKLLTLQTPTTVYECVKRSQFSLSQTIFRPTEQWQIWSQNFTIYFTFDKFVLKRFQLSEISLAIILFEITAKSKFISKCIDKKNVGSLVITNVHQKTMRRRRRRGIFNN